jgi:Zn2+/Cd2+-exporting ATPase
MADQAQVFHITGMDCADCARGIERGVGRMEGVQACTLNYTAATLRVQGVTTREAIVARVRQLGYDVADDSPATASGVYRDARGSGRTLLRPSLFRPMGGVIGFAQFMLQRRNTALALIGALLILPGVLFHELHLWPAAPEYVIAILSIGALLAAGYPVALSAWRTLTINREISMNALMTLAAIGAVIIGATVEAGLVMVLFAIGEALEGYTMERARHSIQSLLQVAPREATVLHPCIDCKEHLGQDGYTAGPCPFCGIEEQRVPVESLHIGDVFVVKPGESIALDGRVHAGTSAVNQAPITGESASVNKRAGDMVYAGSINGEGALEIDVHSLSADSTISRIIRMVEQAQEKRAPSQRFVDRFAHYYTPAVVGIAVLVALVPPLLFGSPFLNTAGAQGWLYRALELLVVACPCALVISTPVSIVSAISNAARHGVLIKGGAYLEALGSIKAIAFDKTGTLTEGRPNVVRVKSVGCHDCTQPGETCGQCDDLLALATAIERRSEHPLARAVIDTAERNGVSSRYPAAAGVTAMAGQGVTGSVDGHTVTVGSHAYFDAEVPHDPQQCGEISASTSQGQTALLVSVDDEYRGYISVADTVRDSSRAALAELKQAGVQVLIMLTGDNATAATTIAGQVGVTEVRAGLLPENKADAVRALVDEYGSVAMVGDGINDAPALATANVGVAMGAGASAQAMETADVVLMTDDLGRLPFALRLSQAALATIRANIALSIGVKLVFLAIVLLGFGSMWMAVLADMGTSLLVTLNGMRLLAYRARPISPTRG